MSALVEALQGPALAALIGASMGWLTARTSAKGAVQAAQVTSLADLEREAGQRAAGIYQHAIERLEGELAEERAERESDRRELDALRRQVDTCRRACRQLARRLGEPDPMIGDEA